jgi:hypothetical protein
MKGKRGNRRRYTHTHTHTQGRRSDIKLRPKRYTLLSEGVAQAHLYRVIVSFPSIYLKDIHTHTHVPIVVGVVGFLLCGCFFFNRFSLSITN